ncbi:oligosaccharide repeat unit polymerase [compost metagenome]
MFFSPHIYAAIITLPILLLTIENPLMWGSQFRTSEETYWHIPAIYAITLLLVALTIKSKKTKKTKSPEREISFSRKLFWIALILACLFQIAKFINIHDIPLFGDPLSRYKITIGGYADYPTQLLAPLCWISIILYKSTRNKIYILASLAPIALTTLLMQRQQAAYCVIGCLIVFTLSKKIKAKTIAILLLCGFASLYLIGYFAILRYGADNISQSVSSLTLPLWIMHAEFTVPTTLSIYAIESMDGNLLYGRYTFSQIYDLLGSTQKTGAELVRATYTNADTAQSIAAPYSYYIDFGTFGLILISIITSVIMTYLYKKSSCSMFHKVLYTLAFLSTLWSIRSGTSIVSIAFLYSTLAIISITKGGDRRIAITRSISRIIIMATLPISAATLIYKI